LDLKETREAVLKSFEKMPWVKAIAMETQNPADKKIIPRCLEMIEECQIYVGLVGSGYGSRFNFGPGTPLAATEIEFDYATSLELYRIVIFSTAPAGEVDDAAAVEAFKRKIGEDCCAGNADFTKPADVANQIVLALAELWDSMKGRMTIDVHRPYDDFASRIETVVDLRRAIASDCGQDVKPQKVWLMLPTCPVPGNTQFLVYMPTFAVHRYLKVPPERRHGSVVKAVQIALDSRPEYLGYIYDFASFCSDTLEAVGGEFLKRSWPVTPIELAQSLWPEPRAAPKELPAAYSLDPNEKEMGKRKMNEQKDQYVSVDGRHVPIIAFFGTKGGVGKTTIVDKFSTLIARGSTAPNVLMVDFDVHHRGLTVLRAGGQISGCRTIHEYIANDDLQFHGAKDVTPNRGAQSAGREFLIPSSSLAAEGVYGSLTRLQPRVLVERIAAILSAAAVQCRADIILVDCGPIVDPLTASAAFMSDVAFIIGQNEPITMESLQNYPTQIKQFLPEFTAQKVRLIMNKVRGPISRNPGIYATIPFTIEVVDYSEGLTDIDAVRLIYLDFCVYGILKSTLKDEYPQLVPGCEVIFPSEQRELIEYVDKYAKTGWYRRLLLGKPLLIAGVSLAVISIVIWALPLRPEEDWTPLLRVSWMYLRPVCLLLGCILCILGGVLNARHRTVNELIRLKRAKGGGYEGFLALTTTPKGRKKFDHVAQWSEKTKREAGA